MFSDFTEKKRKILSDIFSKGTTDTTAVSTVLPSAHKFLILQAQKGFYM